MGRRPATALLLLLLPAWVVAPPSRAQGPGAQGPEAAPGLQDLRLEQSGGGRLRVQSQTTSLEGIFTGIARKMGWEVAMDPDLARELSDRYATLDFTAESADELLEVLGGAAGVATHLAQGRLVLERELEPSRPGGWAERKGRAMEMLRRALLRYPRYSGAWRAYRAMGDLHFREGAFEDAVSEYRVILVLEAPDEVLGGTKLALGRCYMALGDPVRARFYLGDFVRSHPNHPGFVEAYEMIARSFLQENDTNAATSTLELLLDNDLEGPDRARIHRTLGEVLTAAGRFEAAAESYRKALAADLPEKDRVQVHLARAGALLEAGRFEGAIRAAGGLFSVGGWATEEERARAYWIAGRAYHRLGETARELLCLYRARDLDPDSFSILGDWVRVLEDMGLDGGAVGALEAFQATGGDRFRRARLLAPLYERAGLLERAKGQYGTWTRDPKAGLRPIVGIARCLEKQGHPRQSLEALEGVHPEDEALRREADLLRGKCYETLGEVDHALALYTGGSLEMEEGP